MIKNIKKYGLIGKELSHSFSPKYFKEKFEKENISNCQYLAFELDKIEDFKILLEKNLNLRGLNVTIPYKETILPFLDELSSEAKEIGAVNTIQFYTNKLIGHNTDFIGFENSLVPLLKKHHKKALVLGTGGASKAVQFVLNKLSFPFTLISRRKEYNTLIYNELNNKIIQENTLIINTTPIGMQALEGEIPNIPLEAISNQHLVYDLIYNPTKTLLLKQAEKQGATIKNGLEMLQLQAEASWEIWNS